MAHQHYSRLKIKRANDHLTEIKRQVGVYERKAPNPPVRDVETDPNPRVFSYRLDALEKPDDDLTLAIGDFVVNLRSALDHLVHEARGGGKRDGDACFPICQFDMWEADPETGGYRKGSDEDRASFMAKLPDVPPAAVEIIKRAQPSNHGKPKGGIPLAVLLSTFANADKHGDVFSVATGLRDPMSKITVGPYVITHDGKGRVVQPNAVVAEVKARHSWLIKHHPGLTDDERTDLIDRMLAADSDMKVEISGTPAVGIQVSEDSDRPGAPIRVVALPDVLERMLEEVVANVAMPLAVALDWYR